MSRQACLDRRVDPTCLGFPAGPARLRRRVRPIRLGSRVGQLGPSGSSNPFPNSIIFSKQKIEM